MWRAGSIRHRSVTSGRSPSTFARKDRSRTPLNRGTPLVDGDRRWCKIDRGPTHSPGSPVSAFLHRSLSRSDRGARDRPVDVPRGEQGWPRPEAHRGPASRRVKTRARTNSDHEDRRLPAFTPRSPRSQDRAGGASPPRSLPCGACEGERSGNPAASHPNLFDTSREFSLLEHDRKRQQDEADQALQSAEPCPITERGRPRFQPGMKR
jgi:hypothetical protein